jgi:hypothetical protein
MGNTTQRIATWQFMRSLALVMVCGALGGVAYNWRISLGMSAGTGLTIYLASILIGAALTYAGWRLARRRFTLWLWLVVGAFLPNGVLGLVALANGEAHPYNLFYFGATLLFVVFSLVQLRRAQLLPAEYL